MLRYVELNSSSFQPEVINQEKNISVHLLETISTPTHQQIRTG